jgi:hypothetical protein
MFFPIDGSCFIQTFVFNQNHLIEKNTQSKKKKKSSNEKNTNNPIFTLAANINTKTKKIINK